MQKSQYQNACDLPGCQLGIEWEEEGGQRSAQGSRHRLPPRGSLVLAGAPTGPESRGGDCSVNSPVPQMKKQTPMVSLLRAWGTPHKTATHLPHKGQSPT